MKRILSSEKTKRGKPAPPVKGLLDNHFVGITFLLFYESGCDHCMAVLEELKEHYKVLHHSGVRVVSVSTDTDERVYAYHSPSFPWEDKICDYKGFMGENFINYAIIGTPTALVIRNGIIIGRYANLQETEKAIVKYIQQEAVTR
ncbi:MAG: thioredoxin family protein [Tannerellaceae bacterium]|nr:thioredoxin family protein [Tannerellaceae bacterium]